MEKHTVGTKTHSTGSRNLATGAAQEAPQLQGHDVDIGIKGQYRELSLSLLHPISSIKHLWDRTVCSQDVYAYRRMHEALIHASTEEERKSIMCDIRGLWEEVKDDTTDNKNERLNAFLEIAADKHVDARTRKDILLMLCDGGDQMLWTSKRFSKAVSILIQSQALGKEGTEAFAHTLLSLVELLEPETKPHALRKFAQILLACPPETRPTPVMVKLTVQLSKQAMESVESNNSIDAKLFFHLSRELKSNSDIGEEELKALTEAVRDNVSAAIVSGKRSDESIRDLVQGFLSIAAHPQVSLTDRIDLLEALFSWEGNQQQKPALLSPELMETIALLLRDMPLGMGNEDIQNREKIESLLLNIVDQFKYLDQSSSTREALTSVLEKFTHLITDQENNRNGYLVTVGLRLAREIDNGEIHAYRDTRLVRDIYRSILEDKFISPDIKIEAFKDILNARRVSFGAYRESVGPALRSILQDPRLSAETLEALIQLFPLNYSIIRGAANEELLSALKKHPSVIGNTRNANKIYEIFQRSNGINAYLNLLISLHGDERIPPAQQLFLLMQSSKILSKQSQQHLSKFIQKLNAEDLFKNGAPIQACIDVLNNEKASLEERVRALSMLHLYRQEYPSLSSALQLPKIEDEDWAAHCKQLAPDLLALEEATNQEPISLLLEVCTHDTSHLERLLQSSASRIDPKQLLTYLSRTPESQQEAFVRLIFDHFKIPVKDRVQYIAKVANEEGRNRLIEETILTPLNETEASPEERYVVAAKLIDFKQPEPALPILKQIILDLGSESKLRIEAARVLASQGEAIPMEELREAVLNSPTPAGVAEFLSLLTADLDSKRIPLDHYNAAKADFLAKLQTSLINQRETSKEKNVFDKAVADPLYALMASESLLLRHTPATAKEVADIVQSAQSILKDPKLTKTQKFMLAYLPMLQLMNKGVLHDEGRSITISHPDAISCFLEMSTYFLADPAELPLIFNHPDTLVTAIICIREAMNAVGQSGNQAYKELFGSLTWLLDLQPSRSFTFMQYRSSFVTHDVPIVCIETENPLNDEETTHHPKIRTHVQWDSSFISKPLPRPKVPEVNHEDFKQWAQFYKDEVKNNPEALQFLQTTAGINSLGFFMKFAERTEFSSYLQDNRVKGSFVDPTALSLRLIIDHSKKLSDKPGEGDLISPRAQLFQQLLINCQTCKTGFMDAVEMTVRMISIESESELESESALLKESEMREKRDRDAFAANYLRDSVARRKQLLDGESSLARELSGQPSWGRIYQPVHQSWAMRSLLGKHVGTRSEGDAFEKELYLFCVYRTLLNTKPQKALDAFYKHYDVQKEIAYFKELWNERIARDNANIEKQQELKTLKSELGRLEKKKSDQDSEWSSENEARFQELLAMNIDEQLEAIKLENINGQIAAILSGSDLADAYDYDKDFMPLGLNDFGVMKLMIAVGALKEIE